MKKIITICLAVMMAAATVNAKEYKHSLGVVGGSGLGVQYKALPMKNFAIIEEFGYFMCISGAASASGGGGYNGAIDNLVLAYQARQQQWSQRHKSFNFFFHTYYFIV